jgi:2-hydroxychromene-2-carboxylate isomerase
MSESTPEIRFCFDVGSPYAYLASTQIDAVAGRLGTTVDWVPVLVGGIFGATGNTLPAAVPARGAYMLRDLASWAAVYGVPFAFPSAFPPNTLLAMRVLTALERDAGSASMVAAAKALFAAYWSRNVNISDADGVALALADVAVDAAAAIAAAGDPSTKQALKQATDDAVSRGAFGVPSIFVGERLYFGNDRLTLLEAEYPDGVPKHRLIAPTRFDG